MPIRVPELWRDVAVRFPACLCVGLLAFTGWVIRDQTTAIPPAGPVSAVEGFGPAPDTPEPAIARQPAQPTRPDQGTSSGDAPQDAPAPVLPVPQVWTAYQQQPASNPSPSPSRSPQAVQASPTAAPSPEPSDSAEPTPTPELPATPAAATPTPDAD